MVFCPFYAIVELVANTSSFSERCHSGIVLKNGTSPVALFRYFVAVADELNFTKAAWTGRLIVKVAYKSRTIFVRFVGTHAEYDKIDAATV
jgi:hypothetical protein